MGIFSFIADLFKKKEIEEVSQVEEKPKKPKYQGKCELCGKSEENDLKVFLCAYCKKYHCSKHRIPEKHKCTGNPKAPPYENVESWTFGKHT